MHRNEIEKEVFQSYVQTIKVSTQRAGQELSEEKLRQRQSAFHAELDQALVVMANTQSEEAPVLSSATEEFGKLAEEEKASCVREGDSSPHTPLTPTPKHSSPITAEKSKRLVSPQVGTDFPVFQLGISHANACVDKNSRVRY